MGRTLYTCNYNLTQINQLKVLHILSSNNLTELGISVKQEQEDILSDTARTAISGRSVSGPSFCAAVLYVRLQFAIGRRRTGEGNGRGAARIFNGISINY